MSKKVTLNIFGMHCASCSVLVERSLKSIPGAVSVNVNLSSEKAQIVVEDGVLVDSLLSAVEDSGYTASEFVQGDTSSETRKSEMLGSLKKRLGVSLLLSAPLIYFMLMDFSEITPVLMPYMGIVSLLVATPIQFIIGRPFYKGMFSALKLKTFNMDSLIAIGTSVAYFYSLIAYGMYAFTNKSLIGTDGKIHDLYFETSALLITFVLLGKFLETHAKNKTSYAVKKLLDNFPKIAHVIRDGTVVDIGLSEVAVGDIVLVKPGEQVPVDGEIVTGSSSIDESSVTGESMPTEKTIHDFVYSGSINKQGSFEFKAKNVGSTSLLARIIQTVEDAQGSKAPIQELSDRISRYFVPLVLIIALVTFIVWYFILSSTFTFALMSMISVIVIACPCALGLATPTSLMVGTGKGASLGILIKNAKALEIANQIDTIVFDKTGTLTNGKPVVTDVFDVSNIGILEIKRIAASLEKQSEHPLAQAIYQSFIFERSSLHLVSKFISHSGMGVSGEINNTQYWLGNETFLQKMNLSTSTVTEIKKKLESESKSIIYLSDKENILGVIGVSDTVKPEALNALARLKSYKIELFMLTGDNEGTANAIGKLLGIKNVIARVLPTEKAEVIARLKKEGRVVAMVGDGINDAPALATADMSIVMGNGSDISLEAGDIVLMRGNLMDVAVALDLSKQVVKKIKQNMFFALFYNLIGIPIAARAFISIGLLLKPEIAGLAMVLSSISVVINALTLKFYTPFKRNIVSLVVPILMFIIFLVFFVLFAHFDLPIKQNMSAPMSKDTLGSKITASRHEYVSPISINYLRTQKFNSPAPTNETRLNDGSTYEQYIASYKSEDLKINGLLTVPTSPKPEGGFPAIVFVHGYLPPSTYVTTQKYTAYVDYLSRNGFVVYKIDLRGHGNSEGQPSGAYFSSGYTIDAISALKSLQKHPSVNKDRIGIWGHSMAGNASLRAMLVDSGFKAGVIWAGAVYSYEDFAKYRITDSSYVARTPSTQGPVVYDKNREVSEKVRLLRDDPNKLDFSDTFWSSISLTSNIRYLKTPIQLHHAVNDNVVNVGYSRELVEAFKSNSLDYEYYEYDGGGHNIESPYFEIAMERTVEFFHKYL
jgi:Cu+-exporting ATPase